MRQIFAKCVLKVTGTEDTSACQYDQICAGLKSVIDGAVQRVQAIWYTKLTTGYWVFLLTDQKKDFNEINRIGMLWIVCHLFPYGSRFFY